MKQFVSFNESLIVFKHTCGYMWVLLCLQNVTTASAKCFVYFDVLIALAKRAAMLLQ